MVTVKGFSLVGEQTKNSDGGTGPQVCVTLHCEEIYLALRGEGGGQTQNF